MEGYSIRPAAEEDLKTLVEIEREAQSSPWNEEHFRAELDKPYSQTLVMTDDETDAQILGFIVFWMLFDECQVLEIAVARSSRRLGIGQELLRQAVNAALRKNIRKVSLDVRKSNAPAIALYQKHGFTITRIHQRFYSNGEDSYQMTLSLGENRLKF